MTGQWAWAGSADETVPSRRSAKPPPPRVPTTVRAASSDRSTSTPAGSPVSRELVTGTPLSRIRATASSTTAWAPDRTAVSSRAAYPPSREAVVKEGREYAHRMWTRQSSQAARATAQSTAPSDSGDPSTPTRMTPPSDMTCAPFSRRRESDTDHSASQCRVVKATERHRLVRLASTNECPASARAPEARGGSRLGRDPGEEGGPRGRERFPARGRSPKRTGPLRGRCPEEHGQGPTKAGRVQRVREAQAREARNARKRPPRGDDRSTAPARRPQPTRT